MSGVTAAPFKLLAGGARVNHFEFVVHRVADATTVSPEQSAAYF